MILNKTQNSGDRYRIIPGSKGCHGCPANHANHKFEIANGVDRGNGYQGYTSISYFLTQEFISQDIKDKVIRFCKDRKLIYSNT